MRVVASDHAQRRLAGLILFRPHQVAAARRPRTEARPRRKDPRKWKHGIDKPRPVTEARIERSEMRDCRSRMALRSIQATSDQQLRARADAELDAVAVAVAVVAEPRVVDAAAAIGRIE